MVPPETNCFLPSDTGAEVQPDRSPLLLGLSVAISVLLISGIICLIVAPGLFADAKPGLPRLPVITGGERMQTTSLQRQLPDPGTPMRAVFLLGDDLTSTSLDVMMGVMGSSGLPAVERERVDALLTEQDLVRQGMVDDRTSVRLGRMLGGHIALIAQQDGDMIGMRAVLVESGEVVSARACQLAELQTVAGEVLQTASSLLPAAGRLLVSGAGDEAACTIDLGRRHAVRTSDRFAVYDQASGEMVATAVVVEAGSLSSRVELTGAVPQGPAMVRRLLD